MLLKNVPMAGGCILAASVRVEDASRKRVAICDGGVQCRQRQPGIDIPAESIADNLARPGIENDRQIDEARGDGDKRDVSDPKLIGAIYLLISTQN